MTEKEYQSKLRKAKLRLKKAEAEVAKARASAADNSSSSNNMAGEMKDLAMTGVMVSVLRGIIKNNE